MRKEKHAPRGDSARTERKMAMFRTRCLQTSVYGEVLAEWRTTNRTAAGGVRPWYRLAPCALAADRRGGGCWGWPAGAWWAVPGGTGTQDRQGRCLVLRIGPQLLVVVLATVRGPACPYEAFFGLVQTDGGTGGIQ